MSCTQGNSYNSKMNQNDEYKQFTLKDEDPDGELLLLFII